MLAIPRGASDRYWRSFAARTERWSRRNVRKRYDKPTALQPLRRYEPGVMATRAKVGFHIARMQQRGGLTA